MDQQAPQTKAGGGTNDVTIMIVVFVVVTLIILGGFYQFMYKPKTEDIQSMNSQYSAKQNTLKQYISEAKDLYNYYDRLDILDAQWKENKKYYVLGNAVEKNMSAKQYQFEIFEAYEQVFDMGDFAGVEILYLKVAESFKYYMRDDPWDLPWELLQFEWDVVFSERSGSEEGGQAPTQETAAMITAHSFSAVMRADYESLRRFIEVIQNMEGTTKRLISIHCFEVSEEPSYFSYPLARTGGRVLTDVTIEVEMLLTFYELNENGTAGAVPDIPGQTACSFSGGGGGGGGGVRGPGGGGAGTMSMG